MSLNHIVKSFGSTRSPSFFGTNSGLGAFERELETLFGHPFFSGFARGPSAATPAMDVAVSESDVVVTAELPGIDRENLDVSLEDGILTIKAVRHAENVEGEKNDIRRERHVGQFARSLKLPVAVTEKKATASYERGVLRVTLPRSEEARPRKIKIS